MTQATAPSQHLKEALKELNRINSEGLDSTTGVANFSPKDKAKIELAQLDWYKQNAALQAFAKVVGAEAVLRAGMRIVLLSNWEVESATEEGSKAIDWAYNSDSEVMHLELLYSKWVILSSKRPDDKHALPEVKTECSLNELFQYRVNTDNFKWFVVHENDRFF